MTEASSHQQLARAYLESVLGADAPSELRLVAAFDEPRLEGDGAMSVFAFDASVGGGDVESFCVVAGETEPNYYPRWGLDSEEIYNLHLGTRFMLGMEIQQLPAAELSDEHREHITTAIESVAPGEPVETIEPVVAFGLQDQVHLVCRSKIAAQDVYILDGDLPVGFSPRTDLAPHVVYRLHLGRIIRTEETDEPDS